MIIEELKIGKYGIFENKTFNFSSGVNVIEGENESGKSTIADFIRFVFYGTEGKKGRNEGAQGYLILSCPKGRFKVERSYATNAGIPDERVTITDLQINAPLKGKDPAAMFLGTSREIFERSCFFGQFGQRNVGGQALAGALENMLSTADEQINAEKSAQELKAAMDDLSERVLPEIKRTVEDLRTRHERAVRMEEDYLSIKESCKENKNKIETNKKALQECKIKLQRSDALNKLERIKKYNLASEALSHAQEELAEAKARLEKQDFLPDGGYVKSLRALGEKGNRYEEVILEKKEEYTQFKKEFDALPLPEGGKEGELLERVAAASAAVQSNKNFFLMSAAGAGLMLLLMVILFVCKVIAGGVVTGILMLGLLGATGFFFMRKKKAQDEENELYASVGADNRDELSRAVEERARLTERRSALEKRMEEAARKKAKAEEERTAILFESAALAEKWGRRCASVAELSGLLYEAQEAYELLSSLADKEKQARLECSTLQVDYTPEEVKDLIAFVRSGGAKQELSSEEYKKLTMQVNFYDQTSRALEDRTKKQEAQIAELERKMEDRFELAARLAELEAVLGEKERRLQVLTLARESILLAVHRMREKILPGILEDASDFLAGASAGRYTALHTGDQFDLLVLDGKTGKERPIEELSAAMGDLAYLAVRVSLTAKLFGEETVMVFDESFTHLDDLRLASLFMTLAQRASKDNLQILFMTCRKREAALFEKICRPNKISL